MHLFEIFVQKNTQNTQKSAYFDTHIHLLGENIRCNWDFLYFFDTKNTKSAKQAENKMKVFSILIFGFSSLPKMH